MQRDFDQSKFLPTIFREKKKYCHGSFPSSVADVRIGRAKLQKLMRLGQKSASKNVQKFLRLRRPFTFRVAQIRLVLWNFPNYLQRIARNDCKLRNRSSYFGIYSFIFFFFSFYIRLTKWSKANRNIPFR